MIANPCVNVVVQWLRSRKADFSPDLKFVGPYDQFNLFANKQQIQGQLPAVVVQLVSVSEQEQLRGIVEVTNHELLVSLIHPTTSGTNPAQLDLLRSLLGESSLRPGVTALGYDLLEADLGKVEPNYDLEERSLTWMMLPITLVTSRKV